VNRKQGLKMYISVVGCLTAGLVAFDVFFLSKSSAAELRYLAPLATFFIGLQVLCSRQRVYSSDTNAMTLGSVGHMIILLVLPLLPLAILVIAAAKTANELWRKARCETRSWRASVVNISNVVLASAAGGAAFHFLRGNQYLWSHDLHVAIALPAVAGLAVAYFVIDVLVVVMAVSLSSSDPPGSVFRSIVQDNVVPQFSLIFVGVVFAVLWHTNPLLSLFVVVPVIFSVRSFEAVAHLREETVKAVIKVAESIDIRDKGTGEHSDRLACEARRLASAVGLLPEHCREIELAARVHDLGKIGISNEILLKNGPLTPEERKVMEEHPVIGAAILSSYSAFQSSVDIVRHHHERWDGKGYPDKLRGDQIPIGSRIISVVDAFDAMTEDRPYRKGMSRTVAVARLKDGMGSQFDPQVCAAYIRLLIEDGTYRPPESAPMLRLLAPEEVRAATEPLTAAR